MIACWGRKVHRLSCNRTVAGVEVVWGCSAEGLAFGCSSIALRHSCGIAVFLEWQVDARSAAAMLSGNNSTTADSIAEGIRSAAVFSTAWGCSGGVTAAVFGEAPLPCLVAEYNKWINRQQLQQQKGEAALMVLLCHPVAAQVVDGSSVTAMQRDSLLDQQSTWVMASATEPRAGVDAMAPWGISNNIGNRLRCEF